MLLVRIIMSSTDTSKIQSECGQALYLISLIKNDNNTKFREHNENIGISYFQLQNLSNKLTKQNNLLQTKMKGQWVNIPAGIQSCQTLLNSDLGRCCGTVGVPDLEQK